jgi:Tol biopolymer transport system component
MRTDRLWLLRAAAGTASIASLWFTPVAARRFSDWSGPENVGSAVNSIFNEQHPTLSPDGLSLYFVSDRPGGLGGFDIYAAHRTDRDSEWDPPIPIEALNSAASEFAPAFDPGGHLLFFGSERTGGCGGRDLWVSFRSNKHDDVGWEPPVNLGCVVNSPGFDDGPTFFEDEETGLGHLYFVSNRPGGRGDRDIWKTTRDWEGAFAAPTNVAELNSPASDSRPAVRRDGLEMFFTSQRPGSVPLNGVVSSDVWTSIRHSTLDPWSPPVNAGSLNSSAAEAAPALSKEGATLYFNSDRPGGFGALDLYVAHRVKSRTSDDDE